MSATFKQHGLVGDFWPNIRLMQLFGMGFFEYHEDKSVVRTIIRKVYTFGTIGLIVLQYLFLIINFYLGSKMNGEMAADSITLLFFTHPVIKLIYCVKRSALFYQALASWNSVNNHPMFQENNSRHRAVSVSHARKLLMGTVSITVVAIVCWTTSTFFGDSTRNIQDPDNKNETISIDIPRLPIYSFYPWNAMSGMPYVFSFFYQLYYLTMTLFHANLYDLLFCVLLVYATEQLEHLKEAMKPLLEISSSSANIDLFRVNSDDTQEEPVLSKDEQQINIRGIYSNIRDFGLNSNNNGVTSINGPNGFGKKQDLMVRSAIKYWVERHKHVVRYVDSIGDAFGLSLLLHMLTSTVTLTLLAFQATKVGGFDLFTMSVMGYLVYTLGQVFAFCLYGNNLIEVSSSVMEAAYSCQWYEGSEEAKTFVQIVCQQCQKSLSISGAKFFTVSLDLFASVVGAVVTYFMVLVQLK